jgi:hypothetical protein
MKQLPEQRDWTVGYWRETYLLTLLTRWCPKHNKALPLTWQVTQLPRQFRFATLTQAHRRAIKKCSQDDHFLSPHQIFRDESGLHHRLVWYREARTRDHLETFTISGTRPDHLCGIVVWVPRSGFDSQRYQIFWEVVGLERGPLSLVGTTEELLGRKSNGSGLEIRGYGRRDPSRWPRDTLYP